MNGIEDFVRRDDLRDRCIVYELDPIPPTERRDETTLFGEFSKDLPGILGSLFDLCSGALAHGEVSAAALPRMADFFKWALAVEAAAGWSPGTIERAYAEQRQAADAGAMEEPLVAALAKFVAAQGRWSGTSTELLAVLEPFAPVRERGSKWPDGPPRLGGELRRLAPLLRRGGVAVSFLRSGLLRRIVLAHSTDDSTSVPSLPSLPEAAASTVGGRYPDAGDGQRVGGAVASATVPRSGAESEDELRGRAAIPNLASETNNSPAVPSPASPPSPVAASQAFVPMIAAEPDQPSAVASPPLRPSSNSARAEPGGRNDGSGAGDGSVGDQAHLVAVPRISREPNNPDLLSLTSPASLPDAPASTIGSLDTVEGEDERKSAPEEEDLNAQASVTDGVNCDNPSNSIVAEIGCALGDGDDSNDGSAGRLQDGASELTALSSTAIAPGAATAAASDTVVGTGKVPPRWRTIQQVLRGKKMNAAEVVEALRAVNAMPKVKDPVAYIRQELAYGAKKSHFIVVDRGIYTW